MSLSYGLILAVDPYDKLGINVFGFETKAVASSRENKFYMLERSKEEYEAFILGSSTAHRYDTTDLERLTGLKTFNYAVQHTTPEDYVAIINHVKSRFSPKLIIIQMAFVDLDINYLTDKRLASSPLGKFIGEQKSKNTYMNSDIFSNQLLTLDALRDSFRVIFVNLFGEARHIYLEHGNYEDEKPVTGKIDVVQFSHQNWKISPARIEILKMLQTQADQAGIKLVIISAPLAPSHLARIKADTHMNNALKKYKETIFEVFKNVHDFSTEKMNKYNTTEYFRNSTHPSKKLSRLVLEEIWSKK
jgi:hypothetical protein